MVLYKYAYKTILKNMSYNIPTLRGILLTWEKCLTYHSWHHNEEHREQFEIATQHAAGFSMRQRFG